MYSLYRSFHSSFEVSLSGTNLSPSGDNNNDIGASGSSNSAIGSGYRCINNVAILRKKIRKLGQQLTQLYQDVNTLDNQHSQRLEQDAEEDQHEEDEQADDDSEAVNDQEEVVVTEQNGPESEQDPNPAPESTDDIEHDSNSNVNLNVSDGGKTSTADAALHKDNSDHQPVEQLGYRADMGSRSELQDKITNIKQQIHTLTTELQSELQSDAFTPVFVRY